MVHWPLAPPSKQGKFGEDVEPLDFRKRDFYREIAQHFNHVAERMRAEADPFPTRSGEEKDLNVGCEVGANAVR